jgi:hypothetical protein
MKLEILDDHRFTIQDEFLTLDQIDHLSTDYEEVLSRGLIDDPAKPSLDHFSKFGHYDAYNYKLIDTSPELQDVRRVICNVPFIKEMTKLFSAQEITHDILIEYHYHKPLAVSGTPHSDFERVYFKDQPRQDDPCAGVNFFGGTTYRKKSDNDVIVRRRAIAMFIYLNEGWREGYGGETALFNRAPWGSHAIVKKIAPIKNRFFSFLIHPTSYHCSLRSVYERKLIVCWIHGLPL